MPVNLLLYKFLLRLAFVFVLATGIFPAIHSQCVTPVEIWKKLELYPEPDINNKLQNAKQLLSQFERCRLPRDSVFVRLLDRIALFNYLSGGEVLNSIEFAKRAVEFNIANTVGYSRFVRSKSCNNLGFYYEKLGYHSQAINYYDTAIQVAGIDVNCATVKRDARLNKVVNLFELGDYQKCIEESTIGIQEKDNPWHYRLLLKRAEAYCRQMNFNEAYADLLVIKNSSASEDDEWLKIYSLRLDASINAAKGRHLEADRLYKAAINACSNAKDLKVIYNDYGYFLVNSLNDLEAGKALLFKSIQAFIDKEDVANAYVNISQVCWRQNKVSEASLQFMKALKILALDSSNNLKHQVEARRWNLVGDKELLMVMLNNKIELLLTIFKSSLDKTYLQAALRSAIIADTVISWCRHEQSGEESKLYWRNRTKELYQNALEAAFLDNNPALAFYFMEKSRAALLNDRLQDLQAKKLIPAPQADKEQALLLNILQLQAQLSKSSQTDSQQRIKLIEAKASLERFIKSMEKEYPAYFRAKYADDVPTLQSLQDFLKKNGQEFIHFFMNDSVAYIMAIKPSGTILKKIKGNNYNSKAITRFLQLGSNVSLLNSNFNEFRALGTILYRQLFLPLQPGKGRVIICPDHFLIPFEAITLPANSIHYLLEDYSFSYVFAARNLMMQYPMSKANGTYLAIAPIKYATSLHVPELANSGLAAKKSASNYSSRKLIVGTAATRRSLFENLSRYQIVNVFSHALADSSVNEPSIFMVDSMVYLSELQAIKNRCVQLVLLSACQTNVGRNATGEGVYSLARGLSAAGIPSVAATLWQADESAIYALSEKFNEFIAKGEPKDVALQHAKIWYIQQAGKEQTLPYYWSSIILIGNSEPVHIQSHPNYILYTGISIAIIFSVLFFSFRMKRSRNN